MINLYDILEAADGQLFGEASAVLFTDFCLDARRAQSGQLFVALKTDYGDGHQFMREAVERGATGIMCQRPPDFDTDGLTVVIMRDVESALLKWANIALKKLGTTVIAVAGSAASTAAREAIAAVLSVRHRVYKGGDALGGKLSLPLTLGRLAAEDKFAVLEMPSVPNGGMSELAALIKPLVGVVTDLNYSGMERFDLRDALAQEYIALVSSLPQNGLAVLNYDDDQVRTMCQRTAASTLTIGLDRGKVAFGADFTAYNLILGRDRTGFDVRHANERYLGRWVPLLGAHTLYGVLAALAVGSAYDVSVAEGLNAVKALQPLPGRLNLLEGVNNCTLIDDSFDATLPSTLALLDWLRDLRLPAENGRLIFIFGNIGDIGKHTISAHREIGRQAAEIVDILVTEGDLAAVAGRAALDHGMDRRNVRITYSPEDAAASIASWLQPDDVVVIKGGASSHMERTTRALLAKAEDAARLPRYDEQNDEQRTRILPRQTWVEIDRSAIAYNVRRIKEIVGEKVTVVAVVKANGYGHGAVTVASTALNNGAEYLAVSAIGEAIELREAAIEAPILIFGYTPPNVVRQALRYNLTLTLYDLDVARAYNRIARELDAVLRVHVKIDTGLGRVGLLPEQVTPFFRSVRNLRNIEIEGIYTHFASADSNTEYTRAQLQVFENCLAPLRAAGLQFKYIHAANTAATLTMPETHYNMVRPGIGIYGIMPSIGAPLPPDFRPALTWKTTIGVLKTLPKGAYVGYGNTYRTRDVERIAIINVGYADGFRRAPGRWKEVLVHGQRVPVVGRVSMDLSAINVTSVPNVSLGDEVVLIGRQGNEYISVDEVAEWLDTNTYEVVTSIAARVPRL
ncbi:MAG: alanine racemase [Anaerolineae bacterium]|nr:alanine racemase [Anaerolineae bacterium]MDW8299715.1 alanine racemase [Anaerolineae bacterium]